MKSNKTSDLENNSNIEKEIPLEEIKEDNDIEKTADLYFNILYTVIPKDFDPKYGVLASDQGFNKKYVVMWGSGKDLVQFDPDKWRRIAVQLPNNVRFGSLQKIQGDTYGLRFIAREWILDDRSSKIDHAYK